MIVITDKDDIIQYANPGTEQMTGLSGDELVGLSIAQVDELTILPEIRLSEIKAMLKQGKQWAGVIEIRSKWGTRLKLYSVVSPIFDEQKRVVNTISVSREVSYEIALQNELVNAKKMEALGRLSASFAHEFGNPLFGVHSVLRDMSDRLELSPEDKQLLSLAFRECQRMRTMVREFQQLYRDSAGGMEKQGLEVIIAEVLEETKAKLLSVNVELAVKIDPKTKEFAANKDKVFLVLHNIVVNAIESMAKRGGRLDIACYLEEKHIVVLVSDTGVGIKKEHKELIFEPFFSTKPVVEGAGLGLSVAYGTMKNLGGTISFISEEGKGTSFKVHLPIS